MANPIRVAGLTVRPRRSGAQGPPRPVRSGRIPAGV